MKKKAARRFVVLKVSGLDLRVCYVVVGPGIDLRAWVYTGREAAWRMARVFNAVRDEALREAGRGRNMRREVVA
jgi:hypothetical protein